uniref:IF rod domain-containing protein n=1 Tax=Denticeps clupeoides TaxID=299321 RepID=A0AAY4AI34_9TELE
NTRLFPQIPSFCTWATMSRSPERISSYRRHFEEGSALSYQVRVSSPSPPRRDVRHRSASYTRPTAARDLSLGRRTISSTRRPIMASASMGALCVGTALDLESASAENQEYLSTRTSQRQEMVVLNDRLAAYIEKVRSLEQQNKLLEAEIEGLQNRFVKPTGLRKLYEDQLGELRRQADQMKNHRDMAIAAKDAMAGQLEMIKVRYEEALELRRTAELEIENFRPEVDAATSARIALEKQMDNLDVEIDFLKRIQKEEIDELMSQIYSAQASVEDAFSLPDLSAALKQIQLQYDNIAAKNLQEMDTWYKTKFDDLNQKSFKHPDKVRSTREQITNAKKDIQNKERDMDALQTRNEALEAQIREAQEKYKKELEDLNARIEALQVELKSTKEKIALHLREYQDLLNVKMSLEIEITTYRKLIEGEDTRITSMVQGTMGMSSGLGSGMGAGIGIGVGAGAGAVGAGIGGALNGGTIESYTKEQAVELTERKTVLIRTVKTDEDILESNTQERSYIISGAADEEE